MLNNNATSLIRIYRYSDADKGYGDAGTVNYIKVSESDYEVEVHTRYDGSTYNNYEPKSELFTKLESAGWKYYSMGYEFATEERYNDELNTLKSLVKRLECIN